MKRWLIPCALLGVLSCSRGPTLLVSVDGLPSEAKSLQVYATHLDPAKGTEVAALIDPAPYELALPAPAATSLLLRLPGGFSGDIGVNIGAFKESGATGCLLAAGIGNQPMFVGRDETLRVTLQKFTDSKCTGKQPMILSASPNLVSTTGGEKVTLTGWGLKPGAMLSLGGRPAKFTYKSSTLIEAETPSGALPGEGAIRLINPDNKEDQRTDLLRFFAKNLKFQDFPFASSAQYQDGAGLVIDTLSPLQVFGSLEAAVTDPNSNQIRIIYVILMDIKREQKITVGNNPGPLVAADFNGDGFKDLAVANIDDGTIQVILNSADGTFTAQPAVAVGMFPRAIAVGDLDGDKVPDLVVTNTLPGMVSGRVVTLVNRNKGTMNVTNQPLQTGITPVGVAVADFNKDGQSDIAVSNFDLSGIKYTVSVFLNKGAGFYENGGLSSLSIPVECKNPGAIALSDTDGDQNPDLVISCTGESKIVVFKNNGMLNVEPYYLTTDLQPKNFALGDINGDAVADLIVPCAGSNSINIFLNKQGMGFEGVQPFKQTLSCVMPHRVALIDVDKDKRNDLGVAGQGCLAGLFNQSL